MGKTVFKSNRSAFKRKNEAMRDMIMGHIAIDMERYLKTEAGMPVDKGLMKASTRSFKTVEGKHRVEIDKEYAAPQEAGVRLTGKGSPAVMEQYSTPGTSHHFFKRTIDWVRPRRSRYIEEARRAVGI